MSTQVLSYQDTIAERKLNQRFTAILHTVLHLKVSSTSLMVLNLAIKHAMKVVMQLLTRTNIVVFQLTS